MNKDYGIDVSMGPGAVGNARFGVFVFCAFFCAALSLSVPGSPVLRGLADPFAKAPLPAPDFRDNKPGAWHYVQTEGEARARQYAYWGGVLGRINPLLNEAEVMELGRAIVRYSRMYDLPPRLIAAVIKVESGARLRAVSPRGAMGLMQVMPWWAKELNIKEDLFNIDANVRIGCHILAENIRVWGYKEGILRYYRGGLPVGGDGYYVKVQNAVEELAG